MHEHTGAGDFSTRCVFEIDPYVAAFVNALLHFTYGTQRVVGICLNIGDLLTDAALAAAYAQ